MYFVVVFVISLVRYFDRYVVLSSVMYIFVSLMRSLFRYLFSSFVSYVCMSFGRSPCISLVSSFSMCVLLYHCSYLFRPSVLSDVIHLCIYSFRHFFRYVVIGLFSSFVICFVMYVFRPFVFALIDLACYFLK